MEYLGDRSKVGKGGWGMNKNGKREREVSKGRCTQGGCWSVHFGQPCT